MTHKHGAAALTIGMLMTLPGCALLDWIKEKTDGVQPVSKEQNSSSSAAPSPLSQVPTGDTSEVLVFMDGQPLITRNMVETAKNDMFEADPRLKQMVALMDQNQLDLNIVQGLISQAVVDRYIGLKGIDQRDDYRQQIDRALRSVRQMLNTKFFTQDFPVNVGDAEAREFYEKNKDLIPDLLISRGGVRAAFATFDNQADAQAFAEKVAAAQDDIKKAAQDANLGDRFKDFRLVNAQTPGIEPSIREKIVASPKASGIDVIALDNGSYIVVAITGKEESKYQPYAQIEAGIKEYLEREKRVQAYEQEINKLIDQYKISRSKSIEAAMEEMRKQMNAAQPQGM